LIEEMWLSRSFIFLIGVFGDESKFLPWKSLMAAESVCLNIFYLGYVYCCAINAPVAKAVALLLSF